MEKNVRRYQQPERLREELTAAGVRHGETVQATLHGLAMHRRHTIQQGVVQPVGRVKPFFCPMQGVTVNRVIENGDGRRIPHDRTHLDESIRRMLPTCPGPFTIHNAIVTSNGVIHVTAGRHTEVELLHK